MNKSSNNNSTFTTTTTTTTNIISSTISSPSSLVVVVRQEEDCSSRAKNMSVKGSSKAKESSYFESAKEEGASMPSPAQANANANATTTTASNNNGGDTNPVSTLFSRLFQPSPKPASVMTKGEALWSQNEITETKTVPATEYPEAKPSPLDVLSPDHHDSSVDLQEQELQDELEDNRSMLTMTTNATTTGVDVMRDLHDDLDDTADHLSQLQVEFETDLQALAVGLESAFEMPTEFDFGSVHTGMSRMTTDHDVLSVTSLHYMEELASIITSMDDDDDDYDDDDDDDYFGIGEPEQENRDESSLSRKSSEKKQAHAMEAFMTTMEAKMRQAQQSQQLSQQSPISGLPQDSEVKDSKNDDTNIESPQDSQQITQQQKESTPNPQQQQQQQGDNNGQLPQWLQQAWEKFHHLATLKQRMRHERIRRQQLKQQLLQQIKEQQHIQLKNSKLQTIQEDDIGMDASTGGVHSLDVSATTKSSTGGMTAHAPAWREVTTL